MQEASDVRRMLVAQVQMPERGQYLVRVDDALAESGAVAEGSSGRFVVMLDYGEDVGHAVRVERYDPQVHGPRVPGFRLVRPLSPRDERTVADNAKLADAMLAAFLGKVRDAKGLRIVSVRLSFGQKRLFVKHLSNGARVDLSDAQSHLKALYGVEASVWALGPREEAAELGGLGPCGRVCCCCSWQKRFPQHSAPDRDVPSAITINGMCGRFKCCLSFERQGGA